MTIEEEKQLVDLCLLFALGVSQAMGKFEPLQHPAAQEYREHCRFFVQLTQDVLSRMEPLQPSLTVVD